MGMVLLSTNHKETWLHVDRLDAILPFKKTYSKMRSKSPLSISSWTSSLTLEVKPTIKQKNPQFWMIKIPYFKLKTWSLARTYLFYGRFGLPRKPQVVSQSMHPSNKTHQNSSSEQCSKLMFPSIQLIGSWFIGILLVACEIISI